MSLYRKKLVLLHGHGMDDTLWDAITPLLDNQYTLIKPNLSLLTNCHSMEDYADEVHRLLTASQVTKFTLVGHSMGGYIALAFAEKYPDMLEGFALFHSSAMSDGETKKETRNQMAALLRTHGTEAFVRHTAANLFGDSYKERFPDAVERYIQQYSKIPAEALAVGMEAMRDRPDRTQVLTQLTFPILFIIGMEDQIVPFEAVMDQAKHARTVYPFVLAEAGHLGMIERPEAAARILSWYSELDKG